MFRCFVINVILKANAINRSLIVSRSKTNAATICTRLFTSIVAYLAPMHILTIFIHLFPTDSTIFADAAQPNADSQSHTESTYMNTLGWLKVGKFVFHDQWIPTSFKVALSTQSMTIQRPTLLIDNFTL